MGGYAEHVLRSWRDLRKYVRSAFWPFARKDAAALQSFATACRIICYGSQARAAVRHYISQFFFIFKYTKSSETAPRGRLGDPEIMVFEYGLRVFAHLITPGS